MKLFIAVGVAFALLGITEAKVNYAEVTRRCGEHYDVDNDEATSYLEAILNNESVDTTGKVACYFACVLAKTGVEVDKKINIDALLAWFYGSTSEVLETIAYIGEKCGYAYQITSNTCEGAYNFQSCAAGIDSEIFGQTTYSILPNSS